MCTHKHSGTWRITATWLKIHTAACLEELHYFLLTALFKPHQIPCSFSASHPQTPTLLPWKLKPRECVWETPPKLSQLLANPPEPTQLRSVCYCVMVKRGPHSELFHIFLFCLATRSPFGGEDTFSRSPRHFHPLTNHMTQVVLWGAYVSHSAMGHFQIYLLEILVIDHRRRLKRLSRGSRTHQAHSQWTQSLLAR